MKNQFVVFYSWMSDRPCNLNRKYIQKVLDKDSKRLEREFGITIKVDSDSRGADGSSPIEETVLKKISSCDLFVGDITPVSPHFSLFGGNKLTVNSNVMYELGFAVSALGWNRCIMVWNSKYGNLSHAPFDIRNHTTVNYHSGKNKLSLYAVLKSKIENYDKYMKSWRMAKERSYDAEKYENILSICSERSLVDSIDKFLSNRVYNELEFEWWDKLIYYYHHYPDNRFLDEDLHQAYSAFLEELRKMVLIACEHNISISHNTRLDLDVTSEEWKKEQIYRIMDPYQFLDEQKAFELETKIENKFNAIIPSLMDSYNVFRDLVRSKLFL